MSFFRNWSTAKKIVGLVIVVLMFTGYYYVSHMKKSLENMYKVNLFGGVAEYGPGAVPDG
ncbi:hypothetical protein SCACP_28620 [Sporomusa carbonis]|uniref:hypothetical protein n=1 Tax=Sporomusa carbonis TaxID=3076075 RepID=UPI003A6C37E4